VLALIADRATGRTAATAGWPGWSPRSLTTGPAHGGATSRRRRGVWAERCCGRLPHHRTSACCPSPPTTSPSAMSRGRHAGRTPRRGAAHRRQRPGVRDAERHDEPRAPAAGRQASHRRPSARPGTPARAIVVAISRRFRGHAASYVTCFRSAVAFHTAAARGPVALDRHAAADRRGHPARAPTGAQGRTSTRQTQKPLPRLPGAEGEVGAGSKQFCAGAPTLKLLSANPDAFLSHEWGRRTARSTGHCTS
jgi:hypothetical protein